MNNKVASYLVSGVFLTFMALKNLDDFYIFYEGIALAIGITAFIMAGVEYAKKVDEDNS